MALQEAEMVMEVGWAGAVMAAGSAVVASSKLASAVKEALVLVAVEAGF